MAEYPHLRIDYMTKEMTSHFYRCYFQLYIFEKFGKQAINFLGHKSDSESHFYIPELNIV